MSAPGPKKHAELRAEVGRIGGGWHAINLYARAGFIGPIEDALREESNALSVLLTRRELPFNVHATGGMVFVGAPQETVEEICRERGLL